jgi:hypothetical protein
MRHGCSPQAKGEEEEEEVKSLNKLNVSSFIKSVQYHGTTACNGISNYGRCITIVKYAPRVVRA